MRVRGVGAFLMLAAIAAVGSSGLGVSSAGPSVVLPTGQTVTPAGRITTLLAFPTGASVSPDGATALVIAGRPVLTISTPLVLMAVDLPSGRVKQALRVGDAFQSVAWTRDGGSAFVAGGSDAVVHVFSLGSNGMLSAGTDLSLPGCDFATGVAIAKDEKSVWAACPQVSTIYQVATSDGAVLRRVRAPSPDQLALSPDGSRLYATNW